MSVKINLEAPSYESNGWMGIVVNSSDPTFSGRCQIRVFNLFNDIPNEHLPWAVPLNSTVFGTNGAGALSIPKIGQIVRVQFNTGDIYAPEYFAIQNVDTQLIESIKEDYDGTHVLLYDAEEEITIIFQRGSGLVIYHKGSTIQISPDTLITLSTSNNESVIQMDGDITNISTRNEVNISAAGRAEVLADEVVINGTQATKIGRPPYYKAVLAEPMFALLSTLATALDAKFPSTPGVNAGLVEAAKVASTSINVYVGK